jgi:hypothetical protein
MAQVTYTLKVWIIPVIVSAPLVIGCLLLMGLQ